MTKLLLLLVSVFVLAATIQSWKMATTISNNVVAESNIAPIGKKYCPPCVCGRMNLPRITGGSDVKYVHQYPWMAHLHLSGRPYCAASLINSLYVLTAAHCVKGVNTTNITIHLLEHSESVENESKVITRKVDYFVIHANYSNITIDNDIALLKMDQEVELGIGEEYPTPVCLPQEGTPDNDVDAIVIGWGFTSENSSSGSWVLQEVTVPIVSNEECVKVYEPFNQIITSNMICAGDPKNGTDFCTEDNGGPLMVSTNSEQYIIGIVSWGLGCGRYPGLYTNVKQYLKWISNNTADACPCLPN